MDDRFRPAILSAQQEQFLARLTGRFVQRSLLVGGPGTGKTTTATRAADLLLRSGSIDKVLAISGTRVLAEQWRAIGQSLGLDFAAGLDVPRTHDGVAVTLARLEHEGAERLLEIIDPGTRWLVVVEDAEQVNLSSAALVGRVLDQNPASRALFVGSLPPLTDLGVEEAFAFDSEFFTSQALSDPETSARVQLLAPSFGLLHEIQRDLSRVDDLSWREFEKLIATLLERDGYIVDLMRGTKDGGVDVVATKDMGAAGYFKSVWQAKKHRIDRRIGIGLLRELADTRLEHGASKALIVTTSYLTRDALARVERDRYLLGKVDRDDLAGWVSGSLRP